MAQIVITWDEPTGLVSRVDNVPLHETMFCGLMAAATRRGLALISAEAEKTVQIAKPDDVPPVNGHGLRRVP